MKAILTIGIPGSGKSTWAKEFCKENYYKEINRDDIRMDLFNLEFYNEYKMNRVNESLVTDRANYLIDLAKENNQNIVISDTNLNPKYQNILVKKLKDLGYEVEFKLFDIEYFEAVKRCEKRTDKPIPRKVIYDMYRRFMSCKENLGLWEKHTPNPKLPNAYIVDIDGTLADMTGVRGPFEWNKVHLDKPIQAVIDIVNMIYNTGNKIILLSGRDEVCRDLTIQWLHDNGVKFDELFMREKDSTEKDRYVKHRFYEHLKNSYNILGVFDDRPQVALLWHDLGLPLFKIGDPIREF